MSRSRSSFVYVLCPNRSGSSNVAESSPTPAPEKLNDTTPSPARASRSATYGKKPQSLKPWKPWHTTTTGRSPPALVTSPRSGPPSGRVGRLGIRTLAFFWATTLAAIVIGFAVAALSLPLAGVTPDQQAALRQSALADSDAVRHAAEQILSGARFLVELIPSNPLRAAIDGNLLPLIVATTLFAVAAAGLPEEKRRTLTDLADVATAALIRIVWWVLL